MKLLRINSEQEELLVSLASEMVKEGSTIIYPTDTVYGLGCALGQEEGRIFELKRRDWDKPLSLAFPDLEMVKEYVELGKEGEKFIKERLGEPYTFIVKKRQDKISDIVTAGKKTVGVRIPHHVICKKIIEKVGKPIITTSANFSGAPAPCKVEELNPILKEDVDVIVDAGECELGKPSTVIDIKSGKILRE